MFAYASMRRPSCTDQSSAALCHSRASYQGVFPTLSPWHIGLVFTAPAAMKVCAHAVCPSHARAACTRVPTPAGTTICNVGQLNIIRTPMLSATYAHVHPICDSHSRAATHALACGQVAVAPVLAAWADAGGCHRRLRVAWGLYGTAAALLVISGLGLRSRWNPISACRSQMSPGRPSRCASASCRLTCIKGCAVVLFLIGLYPPCRVRLQGCSLRSPVATALPMRALHCVSTHRLCDLSIPAHRCTPVLMAMGPAKASATATTPCRMSSMGRTPAAQRYLLP